jgi:ABC-type glutathione transport system ATPase component
MRAEQFQPMNVTAVARQMAAMIDGGFVQNELLEPYVQDRANWRTMAESFLELTGALTDGNSNTSSAETRYDFLDPRRDQKLRDGRAHRRRAARGDAGRIYAASFWSSSGPSGSGKSTLLNIVGGLDTPSAGRVLFRGDDLAATPRSQRTRYRRHNIGFVFQFYNLMPNLTAEENVELATEIANESDARRKARSPWSGSVDAAPFPVATFGRRTAAGRHRARGREAARRAPLR